MFERLAHLQRSSLQSARGPGIAKSAQKPQKSIGKGFGKRSLGRKESRGQPKKRPSGGEAVRGNRLINRNNETREEHLPSRAADSDSQPQQNTIRGVLLVGFSEEDTESLRTWFGGIEEGLSVACCREDLLTRTMDDIFSAPHGLLQQHSEWHSQRETVPRAVIFSGMTQKEMLGIAEFWNLSGVDEPVFASAVPAVRQTQLRDVLKEVVDAYAQNMDTSRSELDSSSLRDLLRKKVAANNAKSGS